MKAYAKFAGEFLLGAAIVLTPSNAHAQYRQQKQAYTCIKLSNGFDYCNERLFVRPKELPERHAETRTFDRHYVLSYTDRKKGVTTTTDVTGNVQRAIKAEKGKLDSFLQDLRNKGYLPK